MRHYERLLIALLIGAMVLIPLACGNCVSISSGRTITISAHQVAEGEIIWGGLAIFIVPPGTDTISPAVSNSKDGDIFLLQTGNFFDNVVIDRSVSITGAGSASKVDGQQKGSVFTIDSGADVTLADMVITNGKANYGGGIYNAGTLTLNNVEVTGNTATNGGGIFNAGALTLNRGSSIDYNTANNNGGGIYNTGSVNMTAGSSISGNVVPNLYEDGIGGGGIYNTGTVIMNAALITNNTVDDGEGGGIYNSGTVIMVAV
jgi:hypothetical protein